MFITLVKSGPVELYFSVNNAPWLARNEVYLNRNVYKRNIIYEESKGFLGAVVFEHDLPWLHVPSAMKQNIWIEWTAEAVPFDLGLQFFKNKLTSLGLRAVAPYDLIFLFQAYNKPTDSYDLVSGWISRVI